MALANGNVLELECCGVWTEYPTPGRDTECPECKTTFHVSEIISADEFLALSVDDNWMLDPDSFRASE